MGERANPASRYGSRFRRSRGKLRPFRSPSKRHFLDATAPGSCFHDSERSSTPDRQDPRPLRSHRVPGQGRDGGGVSRPGLQARARGCGQAPASGLRPGSRAPGPLPAGGPGAGVAAAPQHRLDLRAGGSRRAGVPGHGAGRGDRPLRAHSSGAGPRGRDARDRPAARRGTRGGPRAARRPPRSQAGQHQGELRGQGQDPRFRPGPGLRGRNRRGGGPGELAHHHRRPDRGWGDPGHRRLHEPGAGAGEEGGPARRHLVLRGDPVRDALGEAPVRGRDGERHPGRGVARRHRMGPAARDHVPRYAPAPGAVPGARSPAAAAGRGGGPHLPGERGHGFLDPGRVIPERHFGGGGGRRPGGSAAFPSGPPRWSLSPWPWEG